MDLKEKIIDFKFKKYWKKQGKQDLATWVYRYLRLHSELLLDNIYQNIYDYYRNTLISYLRKDLENNEIDDIQLGELVDIFTDIFNNQYLEIVNKYNTLVSELYLFWKENSEIIKDILIN